MLVVEDREMYIAKTIDRIHEWNNYLVNKGENTIQRKLLRVNEAVNSYGYKRC